MQIGDITNTQSDKQCPGEIECMRDTTMFLFFQHIKAVFNMFTHDTLEQFILQDNKEILMLNITRHNFNQMLVSAFIGSYVDPSYYHTSTDDTSVVEQTHAFLSLVYDRKHGKIVSYRNATDLAIIYYDAFLAITVLILVLCILLSYFDKKQLQDLRNMIKSKDATNETLPQKPADLTVAPKSATNITFMPTQNIGTQQLMPKKINGMYPFVYRR